MLHQGFPHIGSDAEGRQVRAHQAAEINHDGGDGKDHGHPPIMGNAAIVAGDHIAENSPDIEKRGKGQQLAEARNHHRKVSQHLSFPSVCEKLGKNFFFLFHIGLTILVAAVAADFNLNGGVVDALMNKFLFECFAN